ncbi:ATP-binding protein [Pseudonocardia broussonetiae]|uniref:ATP-binding protein n=1 Tax=Pseudonocardia broussonetiae TaxID=2736640 RepID=A0A6M6JJK4_9PSEU|nr:ATP-binding protein [Pseudonocardia broussonetiae]QJY48238.1 ATP-binding protein [Pseudonocardia broussonetiae]
MAPPSDRGEPTAGRSRSTASHGALRMRLLAEWVTPSLARDRTAEWLRRHRWPQEQLDDLVFAVSEAVSNSVEHGYGISARDPARPGRGQVEVDGHVRGTPDGRRQAVVTVRDAGTWRRPARATGADRGRGLDLMASFMAHLQVDGTASGTTVVITSPPVPA